MSEEAKVEMTPRRVVCSGVTELEDGKLGMVLQEIGEGERMLPERHIFTEKACRKANIFLGGVYTVEATESFTTARLAAAKYEGLWANDEDRTRWKTEERKLRLLRDARKRQKSDAERNAMIEALRPIRDIYLTTNSQGRLAIEVQVLAYLRGIKII